jgi:hypothetical protein
MAALKERQAAEFIKHKMGLEMGMYDEEMRIFQKF